MINAVIYWRAETLRGTTAVYVYSSFARDNVIAALQSKSKLYNRSVVENIFASACCIFHKGRSATRKFRKL